MPLAGALMPLIPRPICLLPPGLQAQTRHLPSAAGSLAAGGFALCCFSACAAEPRGGDAGRGTARSDHPLSPSCPPDEGLELGRALVPGVGRQHRRGYQQSSAGRTRAPRQ